MAQYRKTDVQRGILAAAAKVFAKGGYADATMGSIAQAAGVSVGNLYRYYPGKKALYGAVVTDELVATFLDLLRRRVASLDGVLDVRTLPPTAPFHGISEDLMAFCIANRLGVVILLGRARGTPHERFAAGVAEELIERTIAHFEALRPGVDVTPATRFVLQRIYRNLVDTLVDILARHGAEARIREAVAAWSRYHLAGLNAFFEEEGMP